ncbi:MAG: ribosome silencing factor, partial [Bacteroidetes bacterium]|nr:ribosome silencing factor [Bacteroidota bacterium]
QIRAITDHVIDKVKEGCAEGPFHQEGQQQLQWVLIDYVNVVVHIMHPDSRRFYRLEEMWSDAVLTEYDEA